jgi:DNA primase
VPVTPELRRSALARNDGAGREKIEGLTVLTMLNHPDLLDDYCEEFSRIEIRAATLDRLRNEIIDIAALHAPLERAALINILVSWGLADIAQRLAGGAALKSDRFAGIGASRQEAEAGLLHMLARHRRTITLEMEMRAAERALAEDMNEENWARLQAIHAQLERPELPNALTDGEEGKSGELTG